MTSEEREAIRQKWRDELIERWTTNGQRYYPGREDDAETLAGMYFDQREEIARLNARVGELERDAERYRWMRSKNIGVLGASPEWCGWHGLESLDEQVDRRLS